MVLSPERANFFLIVRAGTATLLAEVDEIDLMRLVEDPSALVQAVGALSPARRQPTAGLRPLDDSAPPAYPSIRTSYRSRVGGSAMKRPSSRMAS